MSTEPKNNKPFEQISRQEVIEFIDRHRKSDTVDPLHKWIGTYNLYRTFRYLISQSYNYLNALAKEALPFMYQTSLEGIRNVLKECWNIYTIESNKEITWFHKIAALKLAKECNKALFKLTADGPSVMYVKLLEERLARIEAEQINR